MPSYCYCYLKTALSSKLELHQAYADHLLERPLEFELLLDFNIHAPCEYFSPVTSHIPVMALAQLVESFGFRAHGSSLLIT